MILENEENPSPEPGLEQLDSLNYATFMYFNLEIIQDLAAYVESLRKAEQQLKQLKQTKDGDPDLRKGMIRREEALIALATREIDLWIIEFGVSIGGAMAGSQPGACERAAAANG